MLKVFLMMALVFAGGVACLLWQMKQQRVRRQYLEQFDFAALLDAALIKRYPQLNEEMRQTVFEGLRDWFKVLALAKQSPVLMPSRVIDDAWQEFILFARNYRHFCQQTLGVFLPHTPARAISSAGLNYEGASQTWRLACQLEGINPASPVRLPRLFALDHKLNIENGFHYTLDSQCLRGLYFQNTRVSSFVADGFDSGIFEGDSADAASVCGGEAGDGGCGVD